MTMQQSSGLGGIRGARRKAVDVASTELVTTSLLPGVEGETPLVVQPAVADVDLAAWAADHREQVDAWLLQHGAVLFRGFGLTLASEFEAVASALCPELFGDYGDLPREGASTKIYQSTPYPPEIPILFHNESSHLPRWPTKQFFFSMIVAEEGGETPILDVRALMHWLPADLVETFETKGLMYVRNFVPGVDVSWQDFFKTDDPAEVEAICSGSGMICEWTDKGHLRIKNPAPAVRPHHITGEKVFFNQVQIHHISQVPTATREALLSIVDVDDLPRNVVFGDGTPIPQEHMDTLARVFDEHCVAFPWQVGDIIMIDNMRVSHARWPFKGPRKIAVAMAEMRGSTELDAHPAFAGS